MALVSKAIALLKNPQAFVVSLEAPEFHSKLEVAIETEVHTYPLIPEIQPESFDKRGMIQL